MKNSGRWVVAYHGCDQKLKDAVLNAQAQLLPKAILKPKDAKNLWLGDGVYFYEENELQAEQWAIDHSRLSKKDTTIKYINEPAILGAVIDLGECMDFATLRTISYAKKALKSIFFLDKKFRNKQNETFAKRELDHAVVDRMCQAYAMDHPEVDTVRCPFVQGRPLGDQTAVGPTSFQDGTHIEICVRNPENILYFFDPSVDSEAIVHNLDPSLKSLVKPVLGQWKNRL